MSDLRFSCLKMLQNWQDLEEYDREIRSKWGTRAEGMLSLEQIEKEAEDKLAASGQTFNEQWQGELKHYSREIATKAGYDWTFDARARGSTE